MNKLHFDSVPLADRDQLTFKLIMLAVIFVTMMTAVNAAWAQPPEQLQVEVSARDHYTRMALDSVQLSLFFDGVLLDSTHTGSDGRAILYVRVTSADQPSEVPHEFLISPNYPNPFLTDTRVDIGVPEAQTVRMEIFNVLGQRVVTQQLHMEAGSYALNLSLGHLPVGVYFLRVGGRDAKVEKMIKMSRTFGSVGPIFRVESTGAGLGNIARPVAVDKGAAYTAMSDEGYLLRAARNRYQTFSASPELEGSHAELLIEMRRNNIVSITTVDPEDEPVSREVKITGEQFNRTIDTPDTLTLVSGIYTVVSTTDSLFAVNDLFEIISRDSTYVIRPFIPMEAEISGRVASDKQEFMSGALLRVFRDGSEYTSTTTGQDGSFHITLMADGGIYSLVIYPDPPLDGSFDPEFYSTFSPDARVITPEPGGSYEMDFILHSESALYIPDGSADLPVGNYTLATDGGTVMVSNIPPDLGIVGGSARAYSPTTSPEIFPGEFATREDGIESGLVSGGFASVNLLQIDGNGGLQPITELRDASGNPVKVELRFKIDPADYHVIRDPATLSDLPGFINRPDTIDAPLYYYDESQGDWRLSPQFGWIENEHGAIPMSELTAVQQGEYEGAIYMTGLVDHFTWYNLDYPSRDACVTGRLMDQAFLPISNRLLSLLSMPEEIGVSFFSNRIEAMTNSNGFFQARVPRTEQGTGDDWNANNRVDTFRFFGQYEDSQPCGVFIFDDDGEGYRTPNFPEEEGCAGLGTIRVTPFEAKKVKFNITFLDIEREDRPDYPLFVTPPSFTGFNYTKATLRDQRVPFMRDAWNCVCQTEIGSQDCNFESSTNTGGTAEFTLPVFQSRPANGLRGTLSYRKNRPDIAEGAYEFADCNYQLDPSVNILASTVNQTVRCEVDRRGPPEVEITRLATDAAFNQGVAFQTQFLYDDLVTIEAEGEDLNEGPVNIFYWTDPGQSTLYSNGRSVTRQAWSLFGTGDNLGIMAHGIDFYGWRGTDLITGISVEEVDIEIEAARDRIAVNDTTQLTASVTGANNTAVTWSVNDPNIATIDALGILTAQSTGEVIVTAASVVDPTRTDQITIEIANLMAVFTINPPSGDSTTVFTFDASVSVGDISLYEWDFGNNVTATGEVVQYSYGVSGVFSVQLTIRDQGGLVSQTVQSVSTTGNPIAVIHADPVSGSPPLTVNFDGSGSFAVSGDIISWNWDFGDGNVFDGETAEYTYTESGIFLSTLTVEDAAGRTGADSLSIIVATGPDAQFTVTPDIGEPPLEVTVDASPSEGNIVRYSWDFGDGTLIPDGNQTEVHTYLATGVFVITLVVEDEMGLTSTSTETVFLGCEDLHPGNIIIQNESDVQQLFGYCGVDGDLVIFNSPFENMEDLSFINVVTGLLDFNFNQLLIDLKGFERMIEVDRIRVTNNQQLESISALQNVKSLSGITISNNSSLVDLEMFRHIANMDGELLISGVPIERLPEFSNLVHAGQIRLTGLNALTSLDGLGELKSVSSLSLSNLPSLSSLTGLEKLTDAYEISLSSLPSLTDDTEFPVLSRVSMISLSSLSQLTDLGIFRALEEFVGEGTGTGSTLHIGVLSELVSLNGLNAIKHLGNLNIQHAPSFTSFDGLQNLDSLRNLRLSNLPALTVMSGLDNVTHLNQLDITTANISSLEGLEQLTSIGTLGLSNLAQLTNLTGLSGLTYLGQLSSINNPLFTGFQGISNNIENPVNISVGNNTGLENMQGLEWLEHAGTINLNGNNLQTLDGLQNLKSIAGGLTITSSHLQDLEPLSGLEQISEVISLGFNASLTTLAGLRNVNPGSSLSLFINNNASLTDLNGLEFMSTSSNISITSNASLSSLNGLQNLETTGDLSITFNNALEHLDDLANVERVNGLVILQNSELSRVTGMSALSRVNGHLNISSNSKLPTCDAHNLRDQLLSRDGIGGLTQINQNDDEGTCPDPS